ncbi:hypothetical protein [Mucilaginibacter ginkgonis]|uniref:Uncharacterized protein n=1 Tax=Mucilaginibacter ginkgonis TaxID=2682091 RepID=A0A6I4I137_9SPHI|nr:hypothetical protein [Mucilaginibacter ginkgonis]QQL48407.1 hypothetical protein GO620_009390 [Mucilaginibacter ginkgonis]
MRRILALLGFVLVIVGTYCPLLRPFYLFDWNLYAVNKPYGVVIFVVAVGGIASFKPQLRRAIAWTLFLLIVILYVGALVKVHTSFSFIPFKNISAKLSHLIKFRWGWSVLFGGSFLAIIGSRVDTKQVVYKKVPPPSV